MQLQQLTSFYWSGKYGSISKAARRQHLSQSAVSHQIQALEAQLGVKLYERVGGGIRLTQHGEVLFRYAGEIVQRMDDLSVHFTELSGDWVRQVTIASYRGITMYLLPEYVYNFKQKYPDTKVTVMSRILDTSVLDMVRAGDVDFGLTSSWNEFDGVDYHEIGCYGMFVCTAAKHRLAGRKNLTLSEIAQEPLVLFEKENSIRRHIDEVFLKHGLSVDVKIETGGAPMVLEYVRRGLGISILSGLSLSTENGSALNAIPATQYFGKLSYGVVIRKGKYLSWAAKEFLRLLGLGEVRFERGL